MSFFKSGLADQGVELGKNVLTLSALGIFTKLLHIDLSELQVLGIKLSPGNANLIPGFIGIALAYVFIAFCVARFEMTMHHETNSESQQTLEQLKQSKNHIVFVCIFLPLASIVYSAPYIVGILSINLLWPESISVLRSIFALL